MEALAERIARFIKGPESRPHPSPLFGKERDVVTSPDDFETLALALFARQFALVEPYRRLCESVNVGPDTCTQWTAIPPVPAAAFKRYNLSCTPVDSAVAVYRSSGTTGAETSRHYMDPDGLALYEYSAKHGFAAAVPTAAGLPLWALMASARQSPASSLSAMLGILDAERFYWEPTPHPQRVSPPRKWEPEKSYGHLWNDLREADEPVVLFGTAFALVQMFDSQDGRLSLPSGSIVIETGGFKGRTREVERSALYNMFAERLGVDPCLCYSEYGMSEMASQFYGRGISAVKNGPHWVRTRIIDPLTGGDAAPGSRGLLAHYDLANFNSVMAIKTEDVGYADGDGGFVLLGRADNAQLRGCSLTVEDLWARERK
jgi:hypothetical protein